MKKIFFLISSIILVTGLKSQTVTKKLTELSYMQDSTEISEKGGNVVVIQDAKMEQVIYNYSKAFKRKPDKIYRVQIYFGVGREGRYKAQSIKNNFEKKYPDIPTYLVFEEPYFKVKVGNFDTKLDAERLKAKLSGTYETTFITEDTDE